MAQEGRFLFKDIYNYIEEGIYQRIIKNKTSLLYEREQSISKLLKGLCIMLVVKVRMMYFMLSYKSLKFDF